MDTHRYLLWSDYLVFALLLILSASIGIYFAWKSRRATTKDYLLGGGKMTTFPVAMSLLASFMSAITLLGTPSEIYVYGLQYIWIGVAYAITLFLATQCYMPVFFRLQLYTSYQYLGKRFHPCLQIIGAVCFILQMVVYMGIVTYAPSLALSAVTGINIWIAVACIMVVATFYTTIGGIKAVVWTDVIQAIIMFGGLTIILIKGTIDVGGVAHIWKVSERNGRTELLNLNINPTVRHTVWTQIFGNAMMWLSIYGINQTMVQRSLTVRNLRSAKIAYWINFPGLVILMLICAACGLIILTAYENCDPVAANRIKKPDQLLPLFVMDYLSSIPCFAGIFVSSVFSGSLSTVSSGINSLASVTLHDILGFFTFFKNLSEYEKTRVCKIIAFIYGVLTLGMAFLASKLGQILQAAIGLFGMLGGPMLGIFTLGMFVPFANWKGALIGHLTSQAFVFWIAFGYFINGVKQPKLPISIEGCKHPNETQQYGNFSTTMSSTIYAASNVTIPSSTIEDDNIPSFYKLSYTWYTLVGSVCAFTIGIIVSAILKDNKSQTPNRDFFTPFVRRYIPNTSNPEEMDDDHKYVDFIKDRKNSELASSSASIPLKTIPDIDEEED